MIERSPYTAAQAAALLGVSKVALVRWLKQGRIPSFKIGYGIRAEWRINHDDLMAFKIDPLKKAA